MQHLSVIKKRNETEIFSFPSELLDDEIIKLHADHRISEEAIGLYIQSTRDLTNSRDQKNSVR